MQYTCKKKVNLIKSTHKHELIEWPKLLTILNLIKWGK